MLPLALDHPAIADKDQLCNLKLLFDNLDLLGHRRGIRTVALKYPHSQGFAGGVGQQADDNLQLALFAIAVIAERAQFVALALQIAAGDVVEKQARRLRPAAALILLIEGPLDLFLTSTQIIEGGVEIVLIERI